MPNETDGAWWLQGDRDESATGSQKVQPDPFGSLPPPSPRQIHSPLHTPEASVWHAPGADDDAESSSSWLRDQATPSQGLDFGRRHHDDDGPDDRADVSSDGADDWSSPYAPSRRPRANRSRRLPPPPPRSATSAPPPASPNRMMRIVLVASLLVLATVIGLVARGFFSNGGAGLALLGFGTPLPTATPTGYARAATVTFTRLTKTIAAPSSTLVAATDGSGAVKATVQTASVTSAKSAAINASYQDVSNVIFELKIQNNDTIQHTSGGELTISTKASNGKTLSCTVEGSVIVPPSPATVLQKCDLPFEQVPAASWDYTDQSTKLHYTGSSPAGGNAAYYYVPTNCGDPTAAETAAQAAMQGQLALPAGGALIFGPSYHYDTSSFGCTPGAGTQQSSPFTFVQSISATATETSYVTADVQAYQLAQVKAHVPPDYAIVSTQICPNGPLVGSGASATRATITCPATALVGWNWTPATLAQLATSIVAADPATATLQLNHTQGIVPGSVAISLVDGSEMPQDPGAITFSVSP